MKIVGLTGGIACGKSTFTSFIRSQGAGFAVIDCDKIVHRVQSKGQAAYQNIVSAFANDNIVLPDGTLDRKRLGEIVFADKSKRKQIEKCTNNAVAKEIIKSLLWHFLAGTSVVVLDSPLLFESKTLAKICCEIIVISTDKPTQIKRLKIRNGYSEEEALARINAQMPLEQKRALATWTVDNSGTRSQLFERFEQDIGPKLKRTGYWDWVSGPRILSVLMAVFYIWWAIRFNVDGSLNRGWLLAHAVPIVSILPFHTLIPRDVRKLHRNERLHVYWRMACLCFSTAVAVILLWFASANTSNQEFSHRLGFRVGGLLSAAFLPLLLASILYFGTIVKFIILQLYYKCSMTETWLSNFPQTPLLCFRNFVLATILEEVLFRSVILSALTMDGTKPTGSMLLYSALLFGLSHLHHVLMAIHQEGMRLKNALILVGFQVFYTGLFGFFQNFLFVRTGHVAGGILVHAFCNAMGLPSPPGRVARTIKIVVGVSYVIGMVGFYLALFPLTDPALYGHVGDM